MPYVITDETVQDLERTLTGPGGVIPIPPFIGLTIGSLRVAEVFVNQGEESLKIEVLYEEITAEHADRLLDRGWQVIEGLFGTSSQPLTNPPS